MASPATSASAWPIDDETRRTEGRASKPSNQGSVLVRAPPGPPPLLKRK
jgi:hypothetical protein